MAAVTTAVVAGAALSYTVYSGEKSRKEAKTAQRKQEQELDRQDKEMKQKRANDDALGKAESARDAQARKQSLLKRDGGGRTGTLLSSPGGTSGQSVGGGSKGSTLIGG